MSIVTVTDAQMHLGIADDDTAALLQLPDYVDAITVPIENHVHEVVAARTFTERVRMRGHRSFILNYTPVIELTSIESLDGATSLNVDDYDPDPSGVVQSISGFTPWGLYRVVYRAGYEPADIPGNYKRGALIVLEHVWETQRGTGLTRRGVVGDEEAFGPDSVTIPRKAEEWLGPSMPNVY